MSRTVRLLFDLYVAMCTRCAERRSDRNKALYLLLHRLPCYPHLEVMSSFHPECRRTLGRLVDSSSQEGEGGFPEGEEDGAGLDSVAIYLPYGTLWHDFT